MNKNKKSLVIIITVIALLLIIGITYALWTRSYVQKEQNAISANCFNIIFKDEEEVVMQSMFPQTDEEGLTNEAYKVTIENTCEMPISYRVKLRLIENTLKEQYIKIGVGTNIVTLNEVPKEGSNYIIREDILPWKGKRILDIRSWMEENTPLYEGQNKGYSYKIDIEGTTYDGMKYLAKELTANNRVQEEIPDFKHYSPEEVCNNWNSTTQTCDGTWIEKDYGSGLFATEDNEGTTYYFRGAVDNNNVKFANMDWKIIRINGDGSIRLMLNASAGRVAFNSVDKELKYGGYTYDNANDKACTKKEPCISNYNPQTQSFRMSNKTTDSTIKNYLENTWYKDNLIANDKEIALTTYCNDTSRVTEGCNIYSPCFGPYSRYGASNPNLPILTCPDPTEHNSTNTHNYGGVYKLKIGLITYDELNMLGHYPNRRPTGFRLKSTHYLQYANNTYDRYLTMSPLFIIQTGVFVAVGEGSAFFDDHIPTPYLIMPVINLKSDVDFTGSGTEEDPYVIN